MADEPVPVVLVLTGRFLFLLDASETIPGGKYYDTDGTTLVNCWNQPIDEDGTVLEEAPRTRW